MGYTLTTCNCGSNIDTYINGTSVKFYAPETMYFPKNSSNLFSYMSAVSSIVFKPGSINTSKVTNMSWMFGYDRYNLTTLDLTEFDTSNVTNMTAMFSICEALNFVNLSSFNITNVTSLDTMFNDCRGFTGTVGPNGSSIRLGNNFIGPQLTNVANLFRLCHNITSIDITNLDTSQVIDMEEMFDGCYLLTTIYVGSG